MGHCCSSCCFCHIVQEQRQAGRREHQEILFYFVPRPDKKSVLLGVCKHNQESHNISLQHYLLSSINHLSTDVLYCIIGYDRKDSEKAQAIQAKGEQSDRNKGNHSWNHNTVLWSIV